MTFESISVEKTDEDTYKIAGDLTIKGITKPVELKAEFGGTMADFYGNLKAGFEITGKVNRKEYGLNWSAITEAGGIVVGDDVEPALNVQVARPA